MFHHYRIAIMSLYFSGAWSTYILRGLMFRISLFWFSVTLRFLSHFDHLHNMQFWILVQPFTISLERHLCISLLLHILWRGVRSGWLIIVQSIHLEYKNAWVCYIYLFIIFRASTHCHIVFCDVGRDFELIFGDCRVQVFHTGQRMYLCLDCGCHKRSEPPSHHFRPDCRMHDVERF